MPSERTTDCLVDSIETAISLVKHEANKSGVSIEHETLAEVPPVSIDAVRIQQVLVNLLRNAIEATKEKSQDPQVRIWTDTKQAMVEVAVADNGTGLPVEREERVFDAFHSTKPDGMGLGLAISKTIVEAHGGTLEAQNRTEGGAVFRFTLPI